MKMMRFCNTGFDADKLLWFYIDKEETKIGLILDNDVTTLTVRGEGDKTELDEWLCNELCSERESCNG